MPGVPIGSYDGEDLYGCPRLMVEPWCSFYLKLYGHYKNGILWNAGGLADQPALYVSVMEIIDAEVHKWEKANMPSKPPGTAGGDADTGSVKDPRAYASALGVRR